VRASCGGLSWRDAYVFDRGLPLLLKFNDWLSNQDLRQPGDLFSQIFHRISTLLIVCDP
jgi:hypothetical protein